MATNNKIRIEYMALASLLKRRRNPKDHDVGQIHSSLNRFGFVNPFIIDDGNGELVAGHGRLDTLQQKFEKGEAPPDRVTIDKDGMWKVPVVRGVTFASEREAEAYCIADNRLCELGGWNAKELADVLTDFAKDGDGMMAGIGFDTNDLNNLLAGQAVGSDGSAGKKTEVICPKCGCRFEK